MWPPNAMHQRATVLLVLATCSTLTQLAEARDMASRGEFSLQISERGTEFTERVKVSKNNTVTIQVPAHNDVDQSDLLNDYEQRLSVTRIPRLRECHVVEMPADESSPEQVLMDFAKLKLIYKGKPRSIRTIERILMKNGKFNTPSPAMAEFCGSYPIFKMAVIHTSDSANKPQGHRIQKRRSGSRGYLEKMAAYLGDMRGEEESPPDDEDGDDHGSSSSGYGSSGYSSYIAAAHDKVSVGHCRRIDNYDLDDCIESPKEKWRLTRVQHSHTCTYGVKCRTGQKVNGRWVPGECIEEHSGSREICYDISCNTDV